MSSEICPRFVSFLKRGCRLRRPARAGRSVVVTAVVHADDMVEDRAEVSDHIGEGGCLVEGGAMIQTP
jgi:hypothetical protein